MGSTRLCWTDGNQVDNILVYRREPLVKACQPASVTARHLGQVGVGQLAMAYHASQRHVIIRNVVRPKLMARIGRQGSQDLHRCLSGLAFANEKPKKATLGDRAGGKGGLEAGKPGSAGL